MPGQIATLILPSDTSWNEGGIVAKALPASAPTPIDPFAVQHAAHILREDGPHTLLLLSGKAVLGPAQALAWRIAQASSASIMTDGVSIHPNGQGFLAIEDVPYTMDHALVALQRFKHIILVNAKAPVGFFAYPGKPSQKYAANTQLHVLSRYDQDAQIALQALVDELGAPAIAFPKQGPRPQPARGAITPESLAQTVAALLPENAIVSDEGLTFGYLCSSAAQAAAPHDWLTLTGGAIGDGLPMATGAAIASGGQRRVLSLQADGSAMYSLQALWTQAREQLPCTTILLNNRSYNILISEYKNVGASPGKTAMGMLDLGRPPLEWVKIANGMGVEAAQATSIEACADLMVQSFKQRGPFLIELMIGG